MDRPLVAVLDTNVVVSVFLNPGGTPARILASLDSKTYVAAFDARIIAEYRAVLLRPRFGLASQDVQRFVKEFMTRGWPVEPALWSGAMVDESDRTFVEVALAASAILVTGNARHFPQEPWVKTPSAFWAMLTGVGTVGVTEGTVRVVTWSLVKTGST